MGITELWTVPDLARASAVPGHDRVSSRRRFFYLRVRDLLISRLRRVEITSWARPHANYYHFEN